MRYRAYLTAACLAAILPVQACGQTPTHPTPERSSSVMEQISNSPNMQLWDKLIAEELQEAINLENKSESAAETIRQAQAMGVSIVILNDGGDNQYDRANNIVYWDPRKSMVVDKHMGNKLSAALFLLNKLKHAVDTNT